MHSPVLCALWLAICLHVVAVTQAQQNETELEEEPGLKFLDKAMETKLDARGLGDLRKIVKLAEKAIETGLSESNREFAQQIVTSTLYEMADRLVEPVLEGDVDHTWPERRQRALDALRKIIKIDDQNGDAYLLLAKVCRLRKDDRAAGFTAATNAVELFAPIPARKAEALVVKSQLTDDNDLRLAVLEEAIAADADNLEAWSERGNARLVAGDAEAAIADFQHVLEKDEDNLDALQDVVRALSVNEKFDDAMEYINRMIEIEPESGFGYAMRSSLYLMQERTDQALDDLDTAVELEPDNLRILITRAQLLQVKENFDEALEDVDRILELRPGLVDAMLLRADIAIQAERYDEAILTYKDLIERDAGNPDFKLMLAAVYSADARPRRAIEIYTEIVEAAQEPDQYELTEEAAELLTAQALRGRGDVRLAIGEHAAAVEDYEQAMKIMPDDDGVLNNLAWVLATSPKDDVRDGKRGIELATKACELTDYEAAHILSTLAAGYAETGDFETAKKWSAKAVEISEEGEIRGQLAEELESYEEEKPWREFQQQEENPEAEPELGLSDDLILEDA